MGIENDRQTPLEDSRSPGANSPQDTGSGPVATGVMIVFGALMCGLGVPLALSGKSTDNDVATGVGLALVGGLMGLTGTRMTQKDKNNAREVRLARGPWIATGMLIGFAAATVIGLFLVVPSARTAERVNIESDVHGPLLGALEAVEKSTSAGDYETAAAQLRMTIRKFEAYRTGGPTPANWWRDVGAMSKSTATTQPRGNR